RRAGSARVQPPWWARRRRARAGPRVAPPRGRGPAGCRRRCGAPGGSRARRRARPRDRAARRSPSGGPGRRASCSRSSPARRQEARDDLGGLAPLLLLALHLLPAAARELVEAGAAAVLRGAPRRLDVALLLELEEGRVQRAVIDDELRAARLLDAPRDAVAV